MSDTMRDLRPVAWPNRATPERLPYEVDFAPFLGTGEAVSDCTVVVVPPNALTVSPVVRSGAVVRVWIEGGIAGVNYGLEFVAITSLGARIAQRRSLYVEQPLTGGLPPVPPPVDWTALLATAQADTLAAARTYIPPGDGAEPRPVEARLREDGVTARDRGALGDGAADDREGVQAAAAVVDATMAGPSAQYPNVGQRPLVFRSGRYFAPGVVLGNSGTAWTVRGDGDVSQIEGASIELNGQRSRAENLMLMGPGLYGYRLSGSQFRQARATRLSARDREIGLWSVSARAFDQFTDLNLEKNNINVQIDDTFGLDISNSELHAATLDSVQVRRAGELKMHFNRALGSGRHALLAEADRFNQVVECYYVGNTFTVQQRTRSVPILSAADNGAGGTRFTTSPTWPITAVADRGMRFAGGAAAAAATAQITISSSPAGSAISMIAAGGTVLAAGPIPWAGGGSATAAAIRNAINAGTLSHGYTASATANVVTITAPVGAAPNGRAVTWTLSGGFSTTARYAALLGGADTEPAFARFSINNATTGGITQITAGATPLLAAPVPWPAGLSGSAARVALATAIVAAINAGTATHGYTAIASSSFVYVYVPAAEAVSATWRSLTLTPSGDVTVTPLAYVALSLSAASDITAGEVMEIATSSAAGYVGFVGVAHVEDPQTIGVELDFSATATGTLVRPHMLQVNEDSMLLATSVGAYNGQPIVTDIGPDYFETAQPFAGNATGTGSLNNWDVVFRARDFNSNLNDQFITAGNINRLLIDSGLNIQAVGTRLKEQVFIIPWAKPSKRAALFFATMQGRGRTSDTWTPPTIGGAATGWSLIGPYHRANTNLPGSGVLTMRAPHASAGRAQGEAAALNEIGVSEVGLLFKVAGQNFDWTPNEWPIFEHRLRRTANAVLGWDMPSAPAGSRLLMQVRSTDAGVTQGSAGIVTLGNGSVDFFSNGGSTRLLTIASPAGSADYLQIEPGAAATGPILRPIPSGAGSNLRLSAAGTGRIRCLSPVEFSAFTFATVPTASAYTGATIRITDRNQRLATSDGTNWRWMDGVIIS